MYGTVYVRMYVHYMYLSARLSAVLEWSLTYILHSHTLKLWYKSVTSIWANLFDEFVFLWLSATCSAGTCCTLLTIKRISV